MVCAPARDLISHVFPAGCDANARNMDACILTTLNKHVDEMNATIQARVVGEERTYKSADFFGPDAAEEEGVYPVEVLNTLTPSGMAPHQLTADTTRRCAGRLPAQTQQGAGHDGRHAGHHLGLEAVDCAGPVDHWATSWGIVRGAAHQLDVPRLQHGPHPVHAAPAASAPGVLHDHQQGARADLSHSNIICGIAYILKGGNPPPLKPHCANSTVLPLF